MTKQSLGIAGGGQLGLMLTEAAHRLGLNVTVLAPTPESPAGQVADRQIVGDFADPAALFQLASAADVLTFEIESAHAGALSDIAAQKPDRVHPLPRTLTIIHDKLRQKEFLARAEIPVADFAAVKAAKSLRDAAGRWGYPLVLKTRYGGYDGRGNTLIASSQDIAPALERLAGKKLYVEKFVPFVKELAVIAARTREGETAVYPVVETIHRHHICHMVIAPAPVSPEVQAQARRLAERVLSVFGGTGVFGIEMFLTSEGDVLVNEVAPRVHNSGHFTIEACTTSQFEQHVRAVAGLPLGKADMKVPAAVMINILADRTGLAKPRGVEQAESLGDVTVHIYGKKEARPERKMGHITVCAQTVEEAVAKAKAARVCISI